jgi:hypothetical protein
MSTICIEAPGAVAPALRGRRDDPARRNSESVAGYRLALRDRRSVVAELSREELLQVQGEFRTMPEVSGRPLNVGSDEQPSVPTRAVQAVCEGIGWVMASSAFRRVFSQ